jgi:hypothetical protein
LACQVELEARVITSRRDRLTALRGKELGVPPLADVDRTCRRAGATKKWSLEDDPIAQNQSRVAHDAIFPLPLEAQPVDVKP